MALRKEPERRYATAAELAADIDRSLKGLPVIARKDAWAYRGGKFIRRHRVVVAAGALIVLSLVGGLIGTTFGLHRATVSEVKADRRFNEIRSLATTSVFDIHDRIAELPGSTPVREFIVTTGIAYLDNLAAEAGDDNPDLLYELCLAYLRAGDAAGNPYQSSLGQHETALKSYRQAEALGKRLVAIEPANADYAAALISARISIADTTGATQHIDEAHQNQLDLVRITTEFSDKLPDSFLWQHNRVAAQATARDI